MCIRDSLSGLAFDVQPVTEDADAIKKSIRALAGLDKFLEMEGGLVRWHAPVSYTHLRAHETVLDLVCRLLLEKKKHTHLGPLCHTLKRHRTPSTISSHY